ncbi:alpha/beta-hydrolase family protein [Geodermatophilus sp. URMC 63]
MSGHRARPPQVATVAAWTAGLTCVGTPWPLPPPAAVRLTAGLLAALTAWLAVRAAGSLAVLAGDVLRGRTPRARPVVAAVLLLLLAGCGAGPQPGPGVASTGTGDVADVASLSAGESGALRVRVGLDGAATDAGRAQAAVRGLERAGGLARSTVLVAVPTGSGWVDEAALAAVEDLTGGDVATVTVEYADRPSWAEYLLGGQRATRSAGAVVAAVRERLATVPPGTRPRLLVFGESLGAGALAAALPAVGPVDGCLLAGRPGSGGELPVPGCTEVRNPDDPVAWWGPGLLVAPRAGLPWLPVSTFWQVTGALLPAMDQPAGHGHRYGRALAPAWAKLLGTAAR